MPFSAVTGTDRIVEKWSGQEELCFLEQVEGRNDLAVCGYLGCADITTFLSVNTVLFR